MSTFEVNAPYMTGVPGRTTCASTTPKSASAFCWASAAASEAGAIAPIKREGRDHHRLAVLGHRHQSFGHGLIEAARTVDRDDGDEAGTLRNFLEIMPREIAVIRMPSSARPAPMAEQWKTRSEYRRLAR